MAKLETVTFTASGETADGMHSARPSGPMGVVTGRSVNIRSGPGTSHAVVSRAVQNDQLAVTGATDGAWVEVELTLSGELAWIHGKFFRAPQTEVVARN
ncbi:MAG: SH3 domain-containing protein, partial [Pseudomonadota bacterium]